MRRYDRFKVIKEANERLNKKINSIVENMYPGEGSGDMGSVGLTSDQIAEVYNSIKSFTVGNSKAIPGKDYQITSIGDSNREPSDVGRFQIMFNQIDSMNIDGEYISVVISIDREVYDMDDSSLSVTTLQLCSGQNMKAIHTEHDEKVLDSLFPREFMMTYERTYNDMNRAQGEEEEVIDEISGETFKSAVDQARDRGQHPRTWHMGELFLHKLPGTELCGGTIKKAYVLNDNDTMRAIIELRTEEGDKINVYDITNDEWHVRTGAMDRRSARGLFKIAQKFNEDTKYADFTDYFKIIGIHVEGRFGTGKGVILDEAATKMFDKLCGVKVIKESAVPPFDYDQAFQNIHQHKDIFINDLVDMFTQHMSNRYFEGNKNNNNSTTPGSGKWGNWVSAVYEPYKSSSVEDGVAIAMEMGYMTDYLHYEIAFDVIFVCDENLQAQQATFKDLQLYRPAKEFETPVVGNSSREDKPGTFMTLNDPILLQAFNKALHNAYNDIDSFREEIDGLLPNSGHEDGFREPDDDAMSSYDRANVDGYNWAGGDWKPSRDNPFSR